MPDPGCVNRGTCQSEASTARRESSHDDGECGHSWADRDQLTKWALTGRSSSGAIYWRLDRKRCVRGDTVRSTIVFVDAAFRSTIQTRRTGTWTTNSDCCGFTWASPRSFPWSLCCSSRTSAHASCPSAGTHTDHRQGPEPSGLFLFRPPRSIRRARACGPIRRARARDPVRRCARGCRHRPMSHGWLGKARSPRHADAYGVIVTLVTFHKIAEPR